MKIFLIGKTGGVTHWLEDAATAFRAAGHKVRVGAVRRAWLNLAIESALAEPLAASMAAAVARVSPDLILVIGGFHAPTVFLERLAALPGRAPLVGWVGDRFDETASRAAGLYDLVAYTDSGLAARHAELGLASTAIFLPHAANAGPAPPAGPRTPRMVFVGNATPGRRAVLRRIDSPVAVYGPGWASERGSHHDVHPARAPHREVAELYARHLAALNLRNELNVLGGLNQRSFDPCLSATPVVTDDQPDLDLCFDRDSEVLVWRDTDALNALYDRILRFPAEAARVGEAGRRRVLADHTFERRLATLMRAL